MNARKGCTKRIETYRHPEQEMSNCDTVARNYIRTYTKPCLNYIGIDVDASQWHWLGVWGAKADTLFQMGAKLLQTDRNYIEGSLSQTG